MHDIRLIRDDPEAFDAAMARRGVGPQAARLLELDRVHRENETNAQNFKAWRNKKSAEFGKAKGQGNKELENQIYAEIKAADESAPEFEKSGRRRFDALSELPNLPATDVPDGADEGGNVQQKEWGEKRQFNYEPANHADLGPPLGLDFETGAKLSGARFTVLHGQMARFQRALGQFMIDLQTQAGRYQETGVPLLVRDQAMFGTGQLPKFRDEQFFSADSRGRDDLFKKALPSDFEKQMAGAGEGNYLETLNKILDDAPTLEQFWMIPTAEVSLTNIVADSIVSDTELPIRMTALTPCFRSEAGAAGKDTRGYIRQHQFEKVELVTICRPEDSAAEHEAMTLAAEAILEALDLPYRRMLLCAGDMGFSARKTYDLEVWLPGQDAYREISSISNCGDFQARRMNARYRPEGEKGTQFVHTLNGSGLAVGRTLVAVLENYQQEDGSVHVPEVLLPYMGGVTRLTPNP